MATPSVGKKAAALAWSIGLGAVLIMITTVVLLPSTKSASPRAKSNDEAGAGAPVASEEDSSTEASEDSRPIFSGSKAMLPPSLHLGGDEDEAPEAGLSPTDIVTPSDEAESEAASSDDERPIMFGSKAPVVPLFNGESTPPPASTDGKLVPIGENPSGGASVPEPPTTLGPPVPAAEDPPGPPSPYESQGSSPYGQSAAPSQGGTP